MADQLARARQLHYSHRRRRWEAQADRPACGLRSAAIRTSKFKSVTCGNCRRLILSDLARGGFDGALIRGLQRWWSA